MKLGLRLKQIEAMVAPDYNHIWDCCCDHGFLGASLINKQRAPFIHLVDIVPQLIHSLNEKLNQHIPANSECQWDTQCLNISHLPLNDYSGKQLVIIAGIGGDLMAQLVNDITLAHPHKNIDFLLCPVHHLYTLREQLIELKMSLKQEVLVKENKRIYEILLLSTSQHHSPQIPLPSSNITNKPNKVDPVGQAIWQTQGMDKKQQFIKQQVAQEYLNKTLKHYKRMQSGMNDSRVQAILEAYRAVEVRHI